MPEHDSPAQLSRGDWRVVFSRTAHEYRIHQVQDIAAALTFYALLASLPAMLATLAAIGIFGRAETAAENVLRVIQDIGDASVAEALTEPFDQLVNAANAELAFAIGLVATVWAASGYVGAFGRGMNRVYGVKEGRPFWEVRPAMLAVSARPKIPMAASVASIAGSDASSA